MDTSFLEEDYFFLKKLKSEKVFGLLHTMPLVQAAKDHFGNAQAQPPTHPAWCVGGLKSI